MFDGIDDLNRLAADLAAAGPQAAAQASVVVHKTAMDIEATAKVLAPVDTGATMNSIGYDVEPGNDISVVIGPTTHYAPYLEFGTSRMAPHGFMGPALDRHTPSFVAAMTAIGGDIL